MYQSLCRKPQFKHCYICMGWLPIGSYLIVFLYIR
nr:MAG TPA: hypothetical protein [Caudoviricetes sp.]